MTHIRRIRSGLSQIFAPLDSNRPTTKEEEHHDAPAEDVIPSTLLDLPTFSMLNEIAEKKSEIARLENELNLNPLLKGFDKSQKLVCRGLEFSHRVANEMEYLLKSSQILEQALKDPMVHDVLPLPHHLHRKTIESIEACIWMVQNKRWSPLDHEVEWHALIPKLEADITNWVASAKQSEQEFKELKDLKQKLNTVIKNYNHLKI